MEQEQTQQEQEEKSDKDRGARAYLPPRDLYGSSIITLTDPESDLYKFELFLRTLKINSKGKLESVGDPLMNDKGINAVMASVESIVHHTNTLSNFADQDMRFLIIGLADTITKDLMLNRLTYKIERKNRDIIVDNSVRFAYGFARRAFEEGDRKFWKGSVTEIRQTQDTPRQKSIFNPFGWGGKK